MTENKCIEEIPPNNYLGKRKLVLERRIIELPQAIFNEAAKPPYEKHFAMTDLGSMLFIALERAGCKPLFRAANPTKDGFAGIEINVPVYVETDGATQQEALAKVKADIQEIRDTTPIVMQRKRLDNALSALKDLGA